jgi:nicotinamide phosphoribosyltransferase
MFDIAETGGISPILMADSYKASHYNQYPPKATRISSYIEPRGGVFEEGVFFGLQAFVKKYLMSNITAQDVEFADELMRVHGVPFNKAGWMSIVLGYGGRLPITIEAVDEGTVMPVGNVQVQVTSAPSFAWLTSYIETALQRAIWYPSTVATLSREAKKILYAGLVTSSDDPDGQIGFKLHDFGARGATSSEAAMLGGMGHLVNFLGTDTLEAVIGARRFYNEPMAGFSIPATEHSTMTSWTRSGEVAAYQNLLEQYPTGLVACVIDSYDTMNAVGEIYGGVLKDTVMSREGTLVLRPDSGDPVKMPLDVIELAMDKFGYSYTSKGYKVLPDQVRVIQGDGMDLGNIKSLVDQALNRGISVDNFAVGMGGGLLQKVNRDTMKYAMKANAIEIDGVWHDVYKDPITDSGKRSKRGRLALVKRDGQFTTIRKEELVSGGHGTEKNYLSKVFENGWMHREADFSEIRDRASI